MRENFSMKEFLPGDLPLEELLSHDVARKGGYIRP